MSGSVVALILSVAAPSIARDGAGNRVEPLVVVSPRDRAAPVRACTRARDWCATLDGGVLTVVAGAESGARHDFAEHGGTLSFWPRLVRTRDGVMVGVLRDELTGYSGGGARTVVLRLLALRRGRTPEPVLDIPVLGSASIRACFSEADAKRRADACHDEYRYHARLVFDPRGRDVAPVFEYRADATTFPGTISRGADSLAAKPLRPRDLVTVTDPRCTFRRVFRLDRVGRRYRPDRPLPDCGDFTDL